MPAASAAASVMARPHRWTAISASARVVSSDHGTSSPASASSSTRSRTAPAPAAPWHQRSGQVTSPSRRSGQPPRAGSDQDASHASASCASSSAGGASSGQAAAASASAQATPDAPCARPHSGRAESPASRASGQLRPHASTRERCRSSATMAAAWRSWRRERARESRMPARPSVRSLPRTTPAPRAPGRTRRSTPASPTSSPAGASGPVGRAATRQRAADAAELARVRSVQGGAEVRQRPRDPGIAVIEGALARDDRERAASGPAPTPARSARRRRR